MIIVVLKSGRRLFTIDTVARVATGNHLERSNSTEAGTKDELQMCCHMLILICLFGFSYSCRSDSKEMAIAL